MSGKKSPENSCRESNQNENPASRPEIELPVDYVYHLLQEEQYTPCIGSTTTDFLLAMLDYLTDYILELVGAEVSNNIAMHPNPQDGAREGNNNREPPRAFKDVSSLLDEMPGRRKNG